MFGEYAPEKGTELHASSPEDRLGCFGLLSRKRQNNGNGRGHKKYPKLSENEGDAMQG